MGTRADFYVGRGLQAEWLGSIAYDGHPHNLEHLLGVESLTDHDLRAQAYRDQVTAMLGVRQDATMPREGWPWPWTDSHLTDHAYAFDGGHIWVTTWDDQPYSANDAASHWVRAATLAELRRLQEELSAAFIGPGPVFPDMTSIQKVKLVGPGSGLFFMKGDE